jgi:hypothetical protein
MRAEPGPQEWVFQELKAVREMRFRFHQVRKRIFGDTTLY